MKKVIELTYNKEQLEEYLNKPKYKFLGFVGDKMIFTEVIKKETTRHVKQLTNTEKFFKMFIDKQVDNEILNTIQVELGINLSEHKEELLKFVNYRLEKGENDKKTKWEKQKTFEIVSRLRTWFSNNKGWSNTTNNNKGGAKVRKI